MRVMIVGAAGMIGGKLAAHLARRPVLGGHRIELLTLADIATPDPHAPAATEVEAVVVDLSAPGAADSALAGRPDVVFHVAATVMGQADADFAAGYRINFDITRNLLEAIRGIAEDYRPRFVYASSIGVYGPPFPAVIADGARPVPNSSYGTQKAMCELLLADYSRVGIIDGVGLRLPTIAVRPGRPTFGNTGFFSNIIREPLAGREAVLPAADDVRHWFASPRAAVAYLTHAATLDERTLGADRTLTMPGLSISVGEQVAALARIAGEAVAGRIRRATDPSATPSAYPAAFAPERALRLGFAAPEGSFDDIIRFHIEDDRGGCWVR